MGAQKYSESEIRDHLKAFAESGLSGQAYAKSAGISPHNLYYWRQRKVKAKKQEEKPSNFIPIKSALPLAAKSGIKVNCSTPGKLTITVDLMDLMPKLIKLLSEG